MDVLFLSHIDVSVSRSLPLPSSSFFSRINEKTSKRILGEG